MSDENNSNELEPIGDPAPIEVSLGFKILQGMAAAVVVSVSGFLAFSALVAPVCTRGSARSSKLLWQQRQKEIARVIDAARATEAEAQPGAPERQPLAPAKL